MLRKETPKMARDPVAVFWIPENREPMISDMMTTWISLQDHEVISQSGRQLLCVLPAVTVIYSTCASCAVHMLTAPCLSCICLRGL